MFGRNVTPSEPVAPSERIINGDTSNASCDAFKLQKTGGSYLTLARVGDLVVRTSGADAPQSAYVVQVVSDTELILDEDLGFDSNTYNLLRPSVLPLRCPEGLEWVLRAVRAKKGNDVYRVGVWVSDNTRQFLVIDTKRLYDQQGAFKPADGEPWENFSRAGFYLEGQNLLISHDRVIQIRNYLEETLEVAVDGVNKTVDVPQG